MFISREKLRLMQKWVYKNYSVKSSIKRMTKKIRVILLSFIFNQPLMGIVYYSLIKLYPQISQIR